MSGHCRELQDHLSAFLDRELEGENLEKVIRHLQECERCRRCLETLRITRDALKKLERPRMPREVMDRLKRCLHEK